VKNRFDRPLYVVGLLSLALVAGSCKGDMGPAGPAGPTGPTGPAGVIATTVLFYSGETKDVAPSSTPKQLRTLPSFTKVLATTTVQVVWQSHVNGVGQCTFTIHVDGNVSGGYGATISGVDSLEWHPVSTTDVFTGLAAGTHALTLWDRGLGTSCTDNRFNYPNTMVVIEY
jgi:hypothetical protein